MPPLAIREAARADLPGILELYAQPALDDDVVLPLAQAERLFERMRGYPDYRLYVARAGQQVVGTFALLIMDNLGHLGSPSGVVEDVAVAPAWQKRGIGKAMLRFAMQRCREAGCYKLSLSANLSRTQAHRFYESLGFGKHGFSFLVRFDGRGAAVDPDV